MSKTKGQTKKASLLEASFNIISGAAIAFAITQLLGPLIGYHIAPSSNLMLTTILTLVSVGRSYVWRRIFEGKVKR